MAGAALATCFASGLVLHSSEAKQIPLEDSPRTELQLEDTFRSRDLWLVTKPPLSEFQIGRAHV